MIKVWDRNEDVPVAMAGEELAQPIFWVGRQWAVTSYGVECRDGTYAFEADRLGEDWYAHVSRKIWVDAGDLREALEFAHKHFGKRPA
jgi:hypothetical protein